MEDHLVRVITETGNLRGLACVTSGLVAEACSMHGAYPTACAALGRVLSAAALMGALLKTGQRVGLKFEGNGPLRKIIAEAESNGELRGYVAVPEVQLPPRGGKLDVAGALGAAGFLTVRKDLRLKDVYTGVVQLQTSEIGDDLAYYFRESEQTPSAVGLGVFVEATGAVSAAGGFLVQSFPPYDEAAVEQVIRHIDGMESVTDWLRRGNTPEGLLRRIFEGLEVTCLEKRPLRLNCSCSRERVETALVSLGREGIAGLLSEHGEAEVTCEFCRRRYYFSRGDLETLLRAIN